MNPPPVRPRVAWVALMACLAASPTHAAPAEYWVVQTRACPQVMGTDPWPYLVACRVDDRGCSERRHVAELSATGRPVVVLVHGSYLGAGQATREGARIRADLNAAGALPPDAVVVEFDWPSQLVYPNLVRDANEKPRRAFVAGYHLARFLQAFPAGSRVGLVGQSHGGLAVLSALHLIGGGTLDDGEAVARLSGPVEARLRAVVIAPACDRHWLLPGEALGCALKRPEGVLCLFNRLDPVLIVHPLGKYSDHRRALGKAGMSAHEVGLLGSSRYCQRDIALELGPRHTFAGATARPSIARSMISYTWAADAGGSVAAVDAAR